MTIDELKTAGERKTPVYTAVPGSSEIVAGHVMDVHMATDTCPAHVTIKYKKHRERTVLLDMVFPSMAEAKASDEGRIMEKLRLLKHSIHTEEELIQFLFRNPVTNDEIMRTAVIRFAKNKFSVTL